MSSKRAEQRKQQAIEKTSSAPPPHEYEFLGPPGTFLISVGLPLLACSFYAVCNEEGCSPLSLTIQPFSPSLSTGIFSIKTTILVLMFYGLNLVLHAILPASFHEGAMLRSGNRLVYKCNALLSTLVTLLGLVLLTIISGPDNFVWRYIWDHLVHILVANILVAYSLATFVYVRSCRSASGVELAVGGQSGNMMYDWYIGRELNPRVSLPLIGTIDLKFFCELRPGLLGWVILNMTYIAHQYSKHGWISDSIVLVSSFQFLYVVDSLYMEPAILSTIDIISDGFGFMLAMGDLVVVPFLYSLQGYYLAMYPVYLGSSKVAVILLVQLAGYWIFRSSNSQKDIFRRNPSDPRVAKLRYITTQSGSRLLVSGWWGMARHINYLGDWIMAWAWCLPTSLSGFRIHHDIDGRRSNASPGTGMIVTYFYVIWIAAILIHREMRDEEACSKKYGEDWKEYKRQVRWRIIPYVY